MKRIFIYGDSNTYGFDPAGFGGRYAPEDRWPDIVAERLAGRAAVTADGMNGRQIPGTEAGRRAVTGWMEKEAPVDLFIVMLGSNDMFGYAGGDPEKVAERMKFFLTDVLAAMGGGGSGKLLPENIMIVAPPVIDMGEDPYYARFDTSDGCLSRALRRAAEDLGTRFADACGWDLPMAFDGVHLSEEGHRRLAEHLLEVISL